MGGGHDCRGLHLGVGQALLKGRQHAPRATIPSEAIGDIGERCEAIAYSTSMIHFSPTCMTKFIHICRLCRSFLHLGMLGQLYDHLAATRATPIIMHTKSTTYLCKKSFCRNNAIVALILILSLM